MLLNKPIKGIRTLAVNGNPVCFEHRHEDADGNGVNPANNREFATDRLELKKRHFHA